MLSRRRKSVTTQVGEVLTPILVLPWHGASAAQRDSVQCSAARIVGNRYIVGTGNFWSIF